MGSPVTVLVQIWALVVDFTEDFIERPSEQQHLLLDYPCFLTRHRDIGVSMLARELWIRPEIAGIPRERGYDPTMVRGNCRDHWFVGLLRSVIDRDSLRLPLDT